MGARRREQEDVGGDAARGTAAGRRAAEVGAHKKRPGLVTFAAIMMLVMGSFQLLVVISEVTTSTWLLNLPNDWLYARLLLWALADLGLAALALYGGFDILRGGSLGQFLGYVYAGLGVLRWLIYLTATPVLAVVIIALDVLVIYGLAENSDYFEAL